MRQMRDQGGGNGGQHMLHSNATPEAERYRYKTMRHRHTWPRRIAKLVAAPLYFMYESGQARSILRARSVDKHGNPIPMLTYPANDFLQSVELELRNADVL